MATFLFLRDENPDLACVYGTHLLHNVQINSDKVTYRSSHGDLFLTTSVTKWLIENVGERCITKWTWFGNKLGKAQFAFSDEGDAAHFVLVWGGENNEAL